MMNEPSRPRICMAMLATNGGSSIVAQEIGHGLGLEHGFDVRYCHLRPDQLQNDHFFLDSAPGVKTSALLDIPPSLGGSMDSASALLRIHDAWPFDLLHLHSLQVYGISANLLKQLRKVPFIVTCHGSDILSQHLLDQNLEVAASVLRAADAITCVSQHMADMLRQKIPDLPRIHVISNFVRASWRNAHFACQPQPQRLLHISSMRAVKRPELLLAAFAQLQTCLPAAQLSIVTTRHGVARVQALLASGLHDGRGLDIIDGDQNPDQLTGEYARAQAMVLTSHFEGFGLVVLEALLHHLPVIAPAVGALPEVLGHDWPYLVPEQDEAGLVDGLAHAMLQACTRSAMDDALPARMQAILARYQGPQQIAHYAELYRQVLATPASAPAPAMARSAPCPRS